MLLQGFLIDNRKEALHKRNDGKFYSRTISWPRNDHCVIQGRRIILIKTIDI